MPNDRSSLIVALALTLAAVTPARGDPPPRWSFDQDRAHPFDLSVVGILGWSFGGGVIAGIPVAPRGFSPAINDAFYVEIEGNAGGRPTRAWGGWTQVLVGVRYQLYLLDWFALHFCGRGGVQFSYDPTDPPEPAGYGAFGVMFLASEDIAFRLEGGYGGRIGVTFRF